MTDKKEKKEKEVEERRETKEKREVKEKEAKERKEKEREKINIGELPLYVVVFLFLAFIVVWLLTAPPSFSSFQRNETNESIFKAPRNMSNYEEFKKVLLDADSIAIVENISGTTSNQSQFIYGCGAGLAGSWGRIGKNISKLHTYVIDYYNCTYSRPTLVNETGELYIEKSTEECVEEYKNLPYFYIQYGPSFSIFTNQTAYIYIDETFGYECSFSFFSEEKKK